MIASLWKVGFSLPPSPSKDAIYMYSCSLCRVFLSEQAVHPAREAGDNLEDPPKVWLLQHSHSQGQLPPAGVRHSLLLSINIPTCNYQGPPPTTCISYGSWFHLFKPTPMLSMLFSIKLTVSTTRYPPMTVII